MWVSRKGKLKYTVEVPNPGVIINPASLDNRPIFTRTAYQNQTPSNAILLFKSLTKTPICLPHLMLPKFPADAPESTQ